MPAKTFPLKLQRHASGDGCASADAEISNTITKKLDRINLTSSDVREDHKWLIMRLIRNRARLLAAIALTWQLAVIASVAVVLSCERIAATEHAGMENCPLHSKATCALHGDKHGTHDCDCPTIGCSQTDTAFTALFGAAGIMPPQVDMPVSLAAAEAVPVISLSADLLSLVPLSPPPRI